MSKSNIVLIKDLILAEFSHDIYNYPEKRGGGCSNIKMYFAFNKSNANL